MHKVPNFFIIGAPKSGTTAMSKYLTTHPEVFFTEQNEPGFFDANLRYINPNECAYSNINDYLRLYEKVKVNHKIIGEGSVYIMYSETAIHNILELNPQAKFLIMLRRPFDAFISMHGENLKSSNIGREPHENIEEAWKDLGRRKSLGEMSKVHSTKFRYDELYSYSKPISNLIKNIKPENMMFLFYDDFVENNLKEFKKVCNFLQIDENYVPEIRYVNQRSQSKNNLISKAVGVAARVARRYRFLRFFRGRGLTLNRFTQKKLENPRMRNDFVSEVKKFYKKDILELEQILNRDLSNWY